jgi:hypothetical protein
VFVTGLAALLLVMAPLPGTGDNSTATPPPAVLVGGRSVSTRNNTGGIQRLTIIPSNSAFATYAGGPTVACTTTADRDDFQLSNGQRVPQGTPITSHYIFTEGNAIAFDTPPDHGPSDTPTTPPTTPSRGPLEQATRTFTVFCDRASYDINFRRIITIPLLDPLLDPHQQLNNLRNTLQLDRPTIYTNPIVGTYGGLVTRYPTWLAIHPNAWTTQTSPTQIYRGTTLLLIAQPRQLNFELTFTPNPNKPSPPFHGTIACIPNLPPTTDGQALPALPVLPDQTEPGPNSNCMWTPPGPGTLTITAQITYTITFWANAYTEPDNDYTWTSTPTTYTTGELTAVNTKP